MAQNKNSILRYKILDSCFKQQNHLWSLDDLIARVNKQLKLEHYNTISKRTIQADIQFMRNSSIGYNAPIIIEQGKYYRYSDSIFSIFNRNFSEKDLQTMRQSVAILQQFKNFQLTHSLQHILNKIDDQEKQLSFKQPSHIIFEFEELTQGIQFLNPLYEFISMQQSIIVVYKSYQANSSKQFKCSPYWLKEFNNRWYLFAKLANSKEHIHLALDRIISVMQTTKNEFENNELYEANTYYNNGIGVSVTPKSAPKLIELKVYKHQAPYVLSKPLHPSQRIISETDEFISLNIRVHINIELEQRLLSFGDQMEIISPLSFRNRISEKLNSAVMRYK